MEEKKIILYILFLAIALMCIQGIFLLRESGNLRESRVLIEDVLNEVKTSRKIIDSQKATIEELRKDNIELMLRVKGLDSANSVIRKNLDASFNKANKTINEIRKTIDDIRPIQIH